MELGWTKCRRLFVNDLCDVCVVAVLIVGAGMRGRRGYKGAGARTPLSAAGTCRREMSRRSGGGTRHAASTHASPPAYVAVLGAALLSYINALGGDFVHDDLPAVTRNRDVIGATSLSQLLRDDFWGTPMGDAASHKSYRPLTTLSFRCATTLAVHIYSSMVVSVLASPNYATH